jgi:hypothetical protein
MIPLAKESFSSMNRQGTVATLEHLCDFRWPFGETLRNLMSLMTSKQKILRAAMRKTGRGRATILRWQAQGCHLSDPEDLMAWNLRSIQRGRGNAVRQILRHCRDLDTDLNGHRRDSAGMLNMEMLEKLPPPSGEGAAAALKRLQGLESIFYSRVLEALAKGRSDLISFALTDYRKITESLRMYEREVELAMRDSGQTCSNSSPVSVLNQRGILTFSHTGFNPIESVRTLRQR